MARVEWTHLAEMELYEIAEYIGEQQKRPAIAEKFIRDVFKKCSLYAENPLLGEARPDLGETIRYLRHKRWLIAYEPIRDGIRIVRVVDATRDYPRLF